MARAYLDQLSRTNGLRPQRITDVRAALTRADDIRSPRDRGASAAIGRLDALAGQIDDDAKGAGTDSAKLQALRKNVMELYVSDHPLVCETCGAQADSEAASQG